VAAHPIGSLHFDDCHVPAANRLGEEGAGFKIAMQTLDFFRTTVGACAVGFAQAAFDEALAYAKQREAFGQTLSQFQLIQGKLADMATKISAARLLVFRSAFLKDQGKERVTKESATKRCRFTAGWAFPRDTWWKGSTGKSGCSAFTKGPPRFSG